MHGGGGVYVGVFFCAHIYIFAFYVYVCIYDLVVYMSVYLWLRTCVHISMCGGVCACIWYIWKDICLSKEPSFPCKTVIKFISLQLPLGGMETVSPWRLRVRLPVQNLWKWTNNQLTPKVMENYQAQKMKLTRWVCVCVCNVSYSALFLCSTPNLGFLLSGFLFIHPWYLIQTWSGVHFIPDSDSLNWYQTCPDLAFITFFTTVT